MEEAERCCAQHRHLPTWAAPGVLLLLFRTKYSKRMLGKSQQSVFHDLIVKIKTNSSLSTFYRESTSPCSRSFKSVSGERSLACKLNALRVRKEGISDSENPMPLLLHQFSSLIRHYFLFLPFSLLCFSVRSYSVALYSLELAMKTKLSLNPQGPTCLCLQSIILTFLFF